MADVPSLAELLHRAEAALSMAAQLGADFRAEIPKGRVHVVRPDTWARHEPAFERFSTALIDLKSSIQSPPPGFADVANVLRDAGRVARRIRNAMKKRKGSDFARFADYSPELNTIASRGYEAVRQAMPRPKPDDPFAFVDQPAGEMKPTEERSEKPDAMHAAPEGSKPAMGADGPTDDAYLALLRVFVGNIADDRLLQIKTIVEGELTANCKLQKIDGLIKIPPSASAAALGEMLGITGGAVKQTSWWRSNRYGNKNKDVGRRHHKLSERGDTYERE